MAFDYTQFGGFEAIATVVVVVIATIVISRVVGVVVRLIFRHLAKRAYRPGAYNTMWRVRLGRYGDETGEVKEQRRRMRVDAAASMVSHLISIILWIVATIVVFHRLDLNPAYFLSSAGFIGAGLAIGGQHKVNDYLTGLSVQFEDRYGVGDLIIADVGREAPIEAVVEYIGLFTTRLQDQRGTIHIPNAAIAIVRNRSQEPASATLTVSLPPDIQPAEAVAVMRDLAGSEGLTEVVFLGDLAAEEPTTGAVEINVRTLRSLDPQKRDRLIRRVEAQLEDQSGDW